jgi:hypothetical protein
VYGPPPAYIPSDPLSRRFPIEWKSTYFRRAAPYGTYKCPLCLESFTHEDIDSLEGDHIWPWSFFGDTSWANYRLICSRCNVLRSNKIDTIVRQTLGRGQFREMIISFLRQNLPDWESDPIVLDLVSHSLDIQSCRPSALSDH